ncbi:hypothetical protein ACHAXS_004193 [Conticribra weissflogii]
MTRQFRSKNLGHTDVFVEELGSPHRRDGIVEEWILFLQRLEVTIRLEVVDVHHFQEGLAAFDVA